MLGLDPADVATTLATSDTTFVYVERGVDLDVADRVAALNLPGIGFLPVAKRYYPAGSLAAQVIGVVNVDGVGITGLERQYDDGARGHTRGADGRALRDGTGDRRRRAGRPGATARCRSRDDDRSTDPVPGAAVLATGDQGQPCQGRDRDRDGSPDRGDLRHGDLAEFRSQRLRRRRSEPLRQPGRDRHVGARIGEQDCHGRRGAADGGRLHDTAVHRAGDPRHRRVHDPRLRGTRDRAHDARRHHRPLEQRRDLARRRPGRQRAPPAGLLPTSGTARRPVSGSPARRQG